MDCMHADLRRGSRSLVDDPVTTAPLPSWLAEVPANVGLYSGQVRDPYEYQATSHLQRRIAENMCATSTEVPDETPITATTGFVDDLAQQQPETGWAPRFLGCYALPVRSQSDEDTQLPLHLDHPEITHAKAEQSMRRREQNRKSQRSYRARQTQYTENLQNEINVIGESLQRLQLGNAELLQRLCKLQIDNADLHAHRSGTQEQARGYGSRSSSASTSTGREQPASTSQKPQEDVQALYEPFLAMWHMIQCHLQTTGKGRDCGSALDALQKMVEGQEKQTGRRSGVGSKEEDERTTFERMLNTLKDARIFHQSLGSQASSTSGSISPTGRPGAGRSR